mgnify:CR=1 FL=1
MNRLIYTLQKCRGIANSFGGKFISSVITNDNEKYIWKCRAGHETKECVGIIVERKYLCERCKILDESNFVNHEMFKYALCILFGGCMFKKEAENKYNHVYVSVDLKICIQFYSYNYQNWGFDPVITQSLEKYRSSGYMMIELCNQIPFQLLMEKIIISMNKINLLDHLDDFNEKFCNKYRKIDVIGSGIKILSTVLYPDEKIENLGSIKYVEDSKFIVGLKLIDGNTEMKKEWIKGSRKTMYCIYLKYNLSIEEIITTIYRNYKFLHPEFEYDEELIKKTINFLT